MNSKENMPTFAEQDNENKEVVDEDSISEYSEDRSEGDIPYWEYEDYVDKIAQESWTTE